VGVLVVARRNWNLFTSIIMNTDGYDSGMGTTPDMWEMLSSILSENEEVLPRSLNEAIIALRDGKAIVTKPNNTMEPTTYKCAECGAVVTIVDGDPVRACEHSESVITADLQAVAYGQSSLEQ
jgi:hypothetical protein